MIKRKPTGQKEVPVQWIDICRVMRMMGCMEDLSKAESMRIVSLLKERIAAGTAKKLGRGEYTAIWPEKMRVTAKSAPPATTAGKGRSAKAASGSRGDK